MFVIKVTNALTQQSQDIFVSSTRKSKNGFSVDVRPLAKKFKSAQLALDAIKLFTPNGIYAEAQFEVEPADEPIVYSPAGFILKIIHNESKTTLDECFVSEILKKAKKGQTYLMSTIESEAATFESFEAADTAAKKLVPGPNVRGFEIISPVVSGGKKCECQGPRSALNGVCENCSLPINYEKERLLAAERAKEEASKPKPEVAPPKPEAIPVAVEKKEKKAKNAGPIATSTKGHKSAALFHGFAATAVIRKLAVEGWSLEDTAKAVQKFNKDLSPATVKIQWKAGQKGERGEPAPLTKQQISELK